MQHRFYEMDGTRFVVVFTNGAGGRSPAEQTELTFTRLKYELERSDSRIENIMRITFFMKGREVWKPVREYRQRVFGSGIRPTSSSIFVNRFLPEEALVEVEATAIVGNKAIAKQAVEFDPPRMYLKALVAGKSVFLSGTGGDGKTAEEQAESCFKTMDAYLNELGGAMRDVRRIAIYLKPLEAVDSVSRVLHRVFANSQPYWEVVPADGFAQEDMLLEIEGTAVLAKKQLCPNSQEKTITRHCEVQGNKAIFSSGGEVDH